MKKLKIDFDEVQKAMEDISREAFDYFLDTETGDLIILSEDILERAQVILAAGIDEDMADYEEIEFDEEMDVPDWMEEEIELALTLFLNENGRYVRIPERYAANAFQTMQEFVETVPEARLREELTAILDGKGAFRRFKDALEKYPKERKMWYRYNANKAKEEIRDWLASIGVEREEGNNDAPDDYS